MTDYHYASGEEPRAGDIVRSLKDVLIGPRAVGDVFTVQKISSLGGGVYYHPDQTYTTFLSNLERVS